MWKKNEQKGKSISSQYAFVKEKKKLMSPKNDLDSSSDLETISGDRMPASHFNMKTNSFQGRNEPVWVQITSGCWHTHKFPSGQVSLSLWPFFTSIILQYVSSRQQFPYLPSPPDPPLSASP